MIAMECEAEAVRPALRDGDRLYVSGIGKVNAAAATQRAICEGATEIWNVGLAGGFGATLEIAGLYRADRAVEYDFDLAAVNGTELVDLYALTQGKRELFGPDGLHPNAAGAKVIAEAVYRALCNHPGKESDKQEMK